MGKFEYSSFLDLLKHSLITLNTEGLDRLFLYGTRYLSWKLQFHRFVRSLPNSVATWIYLLIKTVLSQFISVLNKLYPNKYTDADPYKRLFVDPSLIEYTTGEIFSKRRGWVVDGEWDTAGSPYMERPFAKAIEQRFIEQFKWNQTVLAEKYDKSTLENRGEKIDQLYQNIRNDGYKSQYQLFKQSPEIAWGGLNDAMHPLSNEITIDIGRDGELLWNICGQHRLAIAKVLSIERVPVQVFRRHTEWQEIRNKLRRGEFIPEELHNHPDLQDLLNEQ